MSKKRMYLTCVALVSLALPALAADPSLVGWWQFNEGNGLTAADSSGSNNNGTISGPVTWAQSWDATACLSFNGPYNFVRVASSDSLNMTDGITIAAWVWPKWTGNNRIMQKSTEGSDDQYRLLKEWGDNTKFDLPGVGTLNCTGILPKKGEWTHMAATYDAKSMKLYFNGKVVGEQAAAGKATTSDGPLFIGTKHSTAPAGDEYNGLIDDVRIYNRGLSAAEVKAFVPAKLKAYKPNPADGATGVGMPLLQWTAGDTAVFHKVLLGTTPELTEANVVSPRSPVAMFYYAAGLQPGVTYYWRVDEIELNGTIQVGDVWKFRAAQKTAADPKPGDGAKWVDPAGLTLTWFPGSGTSSHDIYFGTSKDDVTNGAGDTYKGNKVAPEFETGPLAENATYYWRIDEVIAGTKYPGAVWSFQTLAPGGGIKAEYYSNLTLTGVPSLTRIEPKIDFAWGANAPAPGVAVDFSVRFTGELDAPFSETYTFYTNVHGAVRLFVNGQKVIENWMPHHMSIEYDGSITLERGRYPIVMEFSDMQWGGDAEICQLSWSSPSIPKAILTAGPLQPPLRAGNPSPKNGAANVPQEVTLRWTAGEEAQQHDVYFGDSQDAVLNATPDSAGIYRGQQALDQTTFTPDTLEWNKTYYWRVDEVNDAATGRPWTGNVWSFTTADCLVVDDFESYTIEEGNRIFDLWTDGWATGLNGSTVGYIDPPFTEQTIVHGGNQSMPLDYNNVNSPFYSEAEREFSPVQNWTVNGVDTLTLYFQGQQSNAAQNLYVVLEDSAGKTAVVVNADPGAVNVTSWTEWKIPLSQFTGVNPAKVKKLYIGVGDRKNPVPDGAGRIYLDDIRVTKP